MVIKYILKKSSFMYKISKDTRQYFISMLIRISPIIGSKYLYRKSTGRKLDLRNPKDINEKLQWIKLFWKHPLIPLCADKYLVRNYVKECGASEILNTLYNVFDNTKEISWEKLPNQFVLKTTHGCGMNYICLDNKKVVKKDVMKMIDKWMKTDYGIKHGELHYSRINRRIICEKYLGDHHGNPPIDYKLYCFNGKVKVVLLVTERMSHPKFIFVDNKWEPIDIGISKFSGGKLPDKPLCFDELIYYAEKLSKPFPFVRVDFYVYHNKPIFGEMTFTPAGCAALYYNDYGRKYLGDLLILPNKKIKRYD